MYVRWERFERGGGLTVKVRVRRTLEGKRLHADEDAVFVLGFVNVCAWVCVRAH